MQSDAIRTVPTAEFPALFREIPEPPKRLYVRGALPDPALPLLSVVGSRKFTSYGRQVVEELIGGLRGTNVGIVSGLARGIDSLAHEAALANGLYTLAIPGGGLADEALYPASHKPLARCIIKSGGGILSEFEPNFRATKWSFPQRNRLVAGISQATLLIEAGEKSGTLITARLATDYNRELLVVPGSIFSPVSRGTHQFLKLGATPVTSTGDIIDLMDLKQKEPTEHTKPMRSLSEFEEKVLSVLSEPIHRDELVRKTNSDAATLGQALMRMELEGLVTAHDNVYRRTT